MTDPIYEAFLASYKSGFLDYLESHDVLYVANLFDAFLRGKEYAESIKQEASKMNADKVKAELKSVQIYTDGACSGNPGPGGWAFVVWNGDNKLEFSNGFVADTTNNRMEMLSVIEALKAYGNLADEITIYSDSQLVIKTINDGWKRNKNLDLWSQLDKEISKCKKINWQWVRGHNGDPKNEEVDKLAVAAIKR